MCKPAEKLFPVYRNSMPCFFYFGCKIVCFSTVRGMDAKQNCAVIHQTICILLASFEHSLCSQTWNELHRLAERATLSVLMWCETANAARAIIIIELRSQALAFAAAALLAHVWVLAHCCWRCLCSGDWSVRTMEKVKQYLAVGSAGTLARARAHTFVFVNTFGNVLHGTCGGADRAIVVCIVFCVWLNWMT